MALHQIIEKHKSKILNQEIVYTNKFIKYNATTNYAIKPSSSLISHSCNSFKYEYTHPILPPHLFTSPVTGKTYIVPIWQEVHPKTTLNDIEWIRPIKREVPKEKNTWKFESSSNPGQFYIVRKTGDTYKCNCSGFFRCRDKNVGCKHVVQAKQITK